MEDLQGVIEFFGKINAIFGLTLTAVFGSLWAALKYLRRLSSYKAKSPVVERLRVVDAYEFASWGWSLRKMMRILYEIDYATFNSSNNVSGANLKKEQQGKLKYWIDIYKKCPEGWILLVKGEREIIGWALFLPLTDDAYRSVVSGSLKDSEIRTRDVVSIDPDRIGEYKIYFVGIAIKSQIYRARGGALMLVYLIKRWLSYFEVGIKIREFCTVAWTFDGRRLCERLGLEAKISMSEGQMYGASGDKLFSRISALVGGKKIAIQ